VGLAKKFLANNEKIKKKLNYFVIYKASFFQQATNNSTWHHH